MHQYNLRSVTRRRLLERARTFNEDNMERQYTALPYPHMCYIRKIADTKTQLKLRQTCKYFQKMNPRLIVKNLVFGRAPPPDADKWDLYVRNFEEMRMIDVVSRGIHCDTYDKRMISKIRRCEAKTIWLYPECELSMEELQFFTKSGMVQTWVSSTTTIHDAGKLISLEDLLLLLPNAECVCTKVQDVTRNVSSKIVSSNNKIKHLFLTFPGPINVDQLYELLKKVFAPKARLVIRFDGLLNNETYLSTFKAKMDAKMKTWTPQNETPTLEIHGLF